MATWTSYPRPRRQSDSMISWLAPTDVASMAYRHRSAPSPPGRLKARGGTRARPRLTSATWNPPMEISLTAAIRLMAERETSWPAAGDSTATFACSTPDQHLGRAAVAFVPGVAGLVRDDSTEAVGGGPRSRCEFVGAPEIALGAGLASNCWPDPSRGFQWQGGYAGPSACMQWLGLILKAKAEDLRASTAARGRGAPLGLRDWRACSGPAKGSHSRCTR